jgi:hypothetical protein
MSAKVRIHCGLVELECVSDKDIALAEDRNLLSGGAGAHANAFPLHGAAGGTGRAEGGEQGILARSDYEGVVARQICFRCYRALEAR